MTNLCLHRVVMPYTEVTFRSFNLLGILLEISGDISVKVIYVCIASMQRVSLLAILHGENRGGVPSYCAQCG
jgi:hypothetical protein